MLQGEGQAVRRWGAGRGVPEGRDSPLGVQGGGCEAGERVPGSRPPPSAW